MTGAGFSELLDLGPKPEQMLLDAGITGIEQLRQPGAVEACQMIRCRDVSASLNHFMRYRAR